jgi:hypothetical protein
VALMLESKIEKIAPPPQAEIFFLLTVMIDIEGPLSKFLESVPTVFCLFRSHRRKGAFRHLTDMVRLYRSPVPVGRRGYITCSIDFYLPLHAAPEQAGGSAPYALTS